MAGLGGSRFNGLRRVAPLALLALVLVPVVRIARAARIAPADLAFNNGAEVTTLDPAAVTGIPEGRVARALFEGLFVKHPRTLEPLPGMAERYELSADGRTYTFHLREARWTNGDPVGADDFVFAWERLLAPETAAEYAYQLWYVVGAREYSRLPSDRLYTPSVEAVWIERVGQERVRVGATGSALGDVDPERPLEVPLGVGDVVGVRGTATDTSGVIPASATREPPHFDTADCADADGRACGALLAFAERHLHVPVSGRVTAVNAELGATVGELLDDPYRAGWVLELEVEPEELDALVREGALLDAADYRAQVFWPRAVGIRALDARTLEVELVAPTPYFVELTATPPLFPVNRRNLEEARARSTATWRIEWLWPEHLVTNGPFRVVERRVNDRIRLAKSDAYWDRDAVALDSIDVLAVEGYATMLNLYLAGEVAWIDRVSTSLVHRLLPRDDFDPVPYLGTYFYRVNTTRPPFDDARVRAALALAIDRRAICEKVMKGGQRPSWSLVPDGLAGYARAELAHARVADDLADYDAAFAADLERARELLAQAGYGAGRGFPAFEIHFHTSEAHRDVAEIVAAGWKEQLGLDARLHNQEWKVSLDTQRALAYDVSRSSWIADYVDPNSFLDVFVTDGPNNRTGWGDVRYDECIRRAAVELDAAERMRLLAEAEAILLRELPCLPIFSYVTQSVYDPRLGGFYDNALDEHFPKHWYWKDDAELAADRAAEPPGVVLAPAHGPKAGKYAVKHVPGQWD